MQTNKGIISFNPTGDPFVDLGGLVIKTINSRFPEKSQLELVKYVVNIYHYCPVKS